MDQPTNHVLSRLTEYIVQSLKRDVPEATIRQAMAQNNLDSSLFDAAFTAAKTQLSVSISSNESKSDTSKLSKGKQLKQSDTTGESQQLSNHKSSAGATSLPQDQAISLHQAPVAPIAETVAVEHTEAQPVVGLKTVQPSLAYNNLSEFANSHETSQSPTLSQPAIQEQTGYISPPAAVSGPIYSNPTPPPYVPHIPEAATVIPLQPSALGPGVEPNMLASSSIPVTPIAITSDPPTNPIGQSLNDIRQHPKLLASVQQTLRSNTATVIMSSLTVAVLIGGLLFLSKLVVDHSFATRFSVLLIAPARLIKILIGASAMYVLAWVAIQAVATIALAPVMLDGLQNRRSHTKSNLKRLAGQSKQLVLASALAGAISLIPAALIVIAPIIAVASSHAVQLAPHILPFLYALSAGWLAISGGFVALAPQAALFERLDPIQAIQRSSSLLDGQRWLLSGMVLGALIIVGIVGLTSGYGLQRLTTLLSWPVILAMAIVTTLLSGLLALMYGIKASKPL